MQEVRTTARIAEELGKLGLDYVKFNPTGLMCEISGGRGPTIVLRADIDALPIQETTGLDYASKEEGRMHACGHDTHAAMLLGAVKLLLGHKRELKGTVRCIFQPGEENGMGAQSIISQGALEGVQLCFGLHSAPDYPVGFFGGHPGPALAATAEFTLTMRGDAAHGATPHASNDTINALCTAINGLNGVVARRINPMENVVISTGILKGGTAFNIIPGECSATGTCRYFNKSFDTTLPALMKEVADGAAMMYGCSAELKYEVHTKAVFNDLAVMDIAKAAALEVVDSSLVQEYPQIMAGDDFGAYSDYAPSAYFFLGGGGSGPGHNGNFCLEDEMLPIGSAIHTLFALKALSK